MHSPGGTQSIGENDKQKLGTSRASSGGASGYHPGSVGDESKRCQPAPEDHPFNSPTEEVPEMENPVLRPPSESSMGSSLGNSM